ncbi:MAG: histidine phosphatase family protein [Myxococcota bacterium]
MERHRWILMRHATAANGSGRDFDRPLTRRGLDEAHRVGERLRAQGTRPDRVITSSARRCVETWQALASGLGEDAGAFAGPGPDVGHENGLYNASARDLLAAIREVGDADTLLVLAHNPGISVLALELDRGRPQDESVLRHGFAPASVAIFEVEGPWSALVAGATQLLHFEHAPHDGKPD